MIVALPACASAQKSASCPAHAKKEACACPHGSGHVCKPNTNPNCKAGCCTKKP
jgi:hypothetical protein